MLRIASLVAVLMPLGACTLWFGDDDDDDDRCLYPAVDYSGGQQEIAPAPLRDPGDLTCDDYGGSYCDPECGPCPEYASIEPIPPIPSYNYCGHICETYGQAQCEADPQCRVVLDADCSFGESTCLTNFTGCFPTDTQQDTSVNCEAADAWECSRSSECTAYHSAGQGACPPGQDCGRPFELCVTEGADPGGCEQTVACDRLPPSCPAGTVPGVRNLCYTDACIPVELCD
jgi:hypothetical protein